MNGIIQHPPQPPARSTMARLISGGLDRHNLKSTKNAIEVMRLIGAMDYDVLFDLAYFAIADIGDEESHRQEFVKRLNEAGLL